MAAASYIRNIFIEPKAMEITMEIFNFKRPLQVHDLPFEKFFMAQTACRVTAFASEIFNLCIIGFYCLYMLRP